MTAPFPPRDVLASWSPGSALKEPQRCPLACFGPAIHPAPGVPGAQPVDRIQKLPGRGQFGAAPRRPTQSDQLATGRWRAQDRRRHGLALGSAGECFRFGRRFLSIPRNHRLASRARASGRFNKLRELRRYPLRKRQLHVGHDYLIRRSSFCLARRESEGAVGQIELPRPPPSPRADEPPSPPAERLGRCLELDPVIRLTLPPSRLVVV